MSKRIDNEAETIDRFLDGLIADKAAEAPSQIDAATADMLRAIAAAEHPTHEADMLEQAQTRVWNRTMAAAGTRRTESGRVRRPWLSWLSTFPRLAAIAAAMVVLVALGSLAIFGNTQSASAAEILSHAEKVADDKATSGLTSYKGTIEGHGTDGSSGVTISFHQDMWFQAPRSERLEFYLDGIIMPTPGPQETPAPEVTLEPSQDPSVNVSDGHTAWSYNPGSNMAVQYDPATADWTGPEFGASSLNSLLSTASEEYEAKLTGSEVVVGRNAHVIELIPKEGTYGASLWTRRTLWIDKETYLTLKEVDQDDRYNRENSWGFTRLELNVPIDANLFKFTPPAGAQIVDGRPASTPTGAEMDRVWRELAAKVSFQLYRPTQLPAKLQPQLPSQELGATNSVMQKFSSKASSTALFIAQSMPGLPFEGNEGEVVQAGPYTGRYLEREFVRILVLKIGETEVLLQGQAEVTKADLLEIAASLQPVEK